MKLSIRLLTALGLALVAPLSTHAAAVLNVTGVSANPGSVSPGQGTTFSIAVTNSGQTVLADDFPIGGSVNASVTLTNTVTFYSFTVTGTATSSAVIAGAGGAGNLTFGALIPSQVTEGGTYTATATISAIPATGSGATATATVSADGVTSIQITNGGAGYTSAPTVSITGGGGSGAVGTANLTGAVVTSVTVTTPGSGYTSAPSVTLSGGGATTQATALANIKGVTTLALGSGGSGYSTAPIVSFTGGGGTGAAATATINAAGVVTGLTLTAPGSNYTSVPTVNLSVANPSVGVSSFGNSSVVLTVTGTPDLQIIALNYGAGTSYVGGDIVPMSISYRNNSRSPGALVNNVPWVPGTDGKGTYFRIQVVLSSNPVYGDADDFRLTFIDRTTKLNADNSVQTYSWNQLVPGNFAGSYYVLAKIDALETTVETIENDLTLNGNNIWLDVNAPRLSIQPTNFPTNYLASTTGSNSGNGYSDNPATSADGRYTVFASDASNLVSGDSNSTRDIFIYDNQTGLTRRLNLSRQGAQGNGPSNRPAITADGRYVAFESTATNLVLGDTNGFSDIFAVDTVTGSISLLSTSSAGVQANSSCFRPSISSNGRYVTFESAATNLGLTATSPGVSQIYLRDRDVLGTGTFDTPGNTSTVLISQSTAGVAGTGNSIQAVISADGAFVAFASDATNLIAADANGFRDVFLRNRAASTTTRVSVATGGAEATGGASRTPSISADGRYIAFASEATNLVTGDTNGVSDVFVYDRTAATTVRVSVSTAGTEASDPSGPGFQLGSINPSISSTGRYVAFASLANNLTPGDAVGQYSTTDANGSLDVFVRDRDVAGSGSFDTAGNVATTMVSVNKFGMQTIRVLGQQSTASADIAPSLSSDGRWVAFPSDAENASGLSHTVTNLISQDANSARDIFLFDRRTNALPGTSTGPKVAITSPGTSSTILVNTPVPITASATAPIGVVATVQFFVNGTSLGTSSTFPYSQTWTPTAVGTYVLSALVTDSFGNPGVSSNVSVTVNAPPSVGVTNPAAGASVVLGVTQSFTATAAASTPGASIANVQFFANNVSLGVVTAAPYTVSWTPTAAGTVNLKVVATDSLGITGTSTVQITVTRPAVPPTVSIVSPGMNLTVGLQTTLTFTATANDADGSVASVKFLANGSLLATKTAAPYTTTFTPPQAGVYTIIAQATDNDGNVTDSLPQVITVLDSNAPVVALRNPATDTTISADSSLLLSARATNNGGIISRVEFYAGSTLLATTTAAPYTFVWRPSAAGTYQIRALAYDGVGMAVSSAVSSVTVGPRVLPVGSIYVRITSPFSGSTVAAFRNITYVVDTNLASTSAKPQVDFYFNGFNQETVSSAPFQTTFNWVTPGAYEFYAVARIDGAVYTSAPVYFTVLPNLPPAVAITSPSTGTTSTVGTTVSIKATATDPDDQIDSVKFLVNGQVVSTSTSFPYSASWTPSSEGVYTLTAIVKDSQGSVGGNQASSSPVYVRVIAPGSIGGSGTVPDSVYTGSYQGGTEVGKFAVVNVAGKTAAFIAATDRGAARNYFYSSLAVDGSGSFSRTSGATSLITGRVTDTGVSGNLDNSRLTYIGSVVPTAGSTVTSGYYNGNVANRPASTLAAIVTANGTLFLYVADGSSFSDAGSGLLGANGSFDVTLAGGTRIYGKVDPVTGFLTGTLIGGPGGTVMAALASGGTFSDGSLRNLSTRGQVGTGANVLIAGFVVGGTSPKQVLVRAIGPTLSSFNVSGALADTQLDLFQGSTRIAVNDNWGGTASLIGASATVGAFPLAAGSLDSALLVQLNPGAYTAQVSGTGGKTGVALVELYDVDSVGAFSPQKITNVATRGVVGTGDNILIAGFIISGGSPKKVLVRGVGPALVPLGYAGAVSDPVLQILRLDGPVRTVVRENDNWEAGNDAVLVADATSKSGAFPLASGSKDAAILISLPPGTYSATVSGVGGATGIGLVEVYEVP